MNKYLLSDDQFDNFYNLYLYSFNREDTQHRKDVFKERYQHSLVYGIINGNRLGSGLFSIPFDVNFHGIDYKMNGIGNVMTAPEYGGRGGASSLMEAALKDMYRNKVTLSYLAPFSFEYYRRFGYEQVFDHSIIEIESQDLPRLKNSSKGHVERFDIQEIPDDLKIMYLNTNHLGGVVRAKWWWDHMLDKHSDYKAATAYDDNDDLIGYLIYYSQGTTFYIHEWVNQTLLSRQLLMKFVIKHQSIFEKFVYESPDPDFKADIFANPDAIKIQVKPYMMARIIDLEAFINRYPTVVLTLPKINFKVDDSLEWNDHVWSLSIENGIPKLTKADGEEFDFELSIQTLTKALFGYRDLNSSFKYGAITGNIEKIDQMNDILVKDKPQLIDYF